MKKRTSPRFAFRRLLAEQLEARTVMDASGWHNSGLLGDVNLDGQVTPADSTEISAFLVRYESTQVAVTPGTCMSNGIFPDANGDWLVNDDDVEFTNGLFGNTSQSNYNGEGGSSLLSEGEGSGSGSSSGSGGGGSSGSGGASGSGSGIWEIGAVNNGGFEPLRDSNGQAYIEFVISFSDHNTFTADSIEWGVFETNLASSGSAGSFGDAEDGVDFQAVNPGVVSVSASTMSANFIVRVNILRDDLLEYTEYFHVKLFNPAATTHVWDPDPVLAEIYDSTPAVDLDNDSNNDGTINASDDAGENTAPSARIVVNTDDDNDNGIPDGSETGPVSGEDDLEPFNLWYADSGYHDVPDFDGWKLVLKFTSGEGTVWEEANKATPVVFTNTQEVGTAKIWTIGTDSIPSTLYLEKLAGGSTGLSLNLHRPDWNGMTPDYVLYTAEPAYPLNITIYHGQNGTAVAEADEDSVGAFTVANRNDTDGDGNIDASDSSVIAAVNAQGDPLGVDEVDLMKLVIDRPLNYVPGTPITITVRSDTAKFWSESTKQSELTQDENGRLEFAIPEGETSKTLWVEAPFPTIGVRNLKIEAKYTLEGRNFKDVVRATAVWSELREYELTDRTAVDVLAGEPWSMIPEDATLHGLIVDIGGTGRTPAKAQNVILQQWEMLPLGIEEEALVKFDVTRRASSIALVRVGANTTQTPGKSVAGLPLDHVNDDDSDVDETGPVQRYLFVGDAPGITADPPATIDSMAVIGLFEEFVRVSIDGELPSGEGLKGSRAADKFKWGSKVKVDWSNEASKFVIDAGFRKIVAGHSFGQ